MTTTSTTRRPSRATRSASDNVVPITTSGRSATGDNGHGRAPKPQPAQDQPKAKAQPNPKSKPTATAGVKPFDRFRAVATKGSEKVTEDDKPNGHITRESAMATAERLAKAQGDGWIAEVTTFDRFMATIQPTAGGPELVCSCRYGQDGALSCSMKLAKANGLYV